MIEYLLMFVVSLILSLIFTPLAEKISVYVGAVDHPNRRKIHEDVIPRLGGLAIYLSFVFSSLVFVDFNLQFKALLGGSLIIIIIGIIDDIRELDPKVKLAGQIIAVAPIVAYNLNVAAISNPLSKLVFAGYLAIPITVIWIVGMINAVNLIDGLDGLAGGVASISALTMAIIAFGSGNLVSCSLALILAGSTLGFLKYNFNPAEIFMGDTGSMFLGYALAVIALFGMTKSATFVTMLAPIVVLGVPIFDVNFAFFRRLITGKNPFKPDKEHLHHRFMHFGFNQKQTVLTIYLIGLVFGVSAILLSKYESSVVLLVVSAILMILFLWLKEFNIIRLGSTINAEPLDILKEIRTNLIKLEHIIEDELELASFHQELGRLEELIDKVPKFVYDEAVEDIDKANYDSLRDRIFLLIEIIDAIIKNYNNNSDNLNHIFQHERSNLLAIYDKLSEDVG
jgi:UDP-GlcNAc:undecaprenyl-phosphate GlcNAc-1-phosphate transferase